MRTCTKCHAEKPVEQFSRSRAASDGLHTWCKACKTERTRQWYAANKAERRRIDREQYAADGAKARAQARRWHIENRQRSLDAKRAWKLRKFGLTAADYDAIMRAQGGVCAICHEVPSTRRRHDLVVDHDHETNTVRGLLCNRCNIGLGHFEDRLGLLFAAINYLRQAKVRNIA